MNKDNIKYVLEKDIERFDTYIERADNKANFILTISGVLLVAVIFQSKDLFSQINNPVIEKLFFLDISIIAISLIGAIYYSLMVIIPRTPSGSYQSMFYFEDVKHLKNNDFYEKLKDTSEEDLFIDYSKQVNQLAMICSKKMNKIKKSYSCLTIVIIGLIIIVLINLIK